LSPYQSCASPKSPREEDIKSVTLNSVNLHYKLERAKETDFNLRNVVHSTENIHYDYNFGPSSYDHDVKPKVQVPQE
jgi:hypothetical protein